MSEWTIQAVLEETVDLLQRAGVGTARRDAELLLRHLLGQGPAFLVSHPRHPVGAAERRRLLAYVRRRRGGEPLQYILGYKEFWKDRFLVTPAVLIPRPETELLVEYGAGSLATRETPRVLDLATGSGCIGLSILREHPTAVVMATDISPAALAVAHANAVRLRLHDRFHLAAGDGTAMFSESARGYFHLVVSNPPYISTKDFPNLDPEIRQFEPVGALLAGPDGLAFFRQWLLPTLTLLAPGGHLLMECGAEQGTMLAELVRGASCPTEFFPDLAGRTRVLHMGPV
ncbi:MAG: peptide chain release factor N(5)-glutamine methyltransferase [Acidobacteria bacterium]|nr:peptide chain release factor N(5)-glutamine methyltransferase [Acidobacteriota bacterium]